MVVLVLFAIATASVVNVDAGNAADVSPASQTDGFVSTSEKAADVAIVAKDADFREATENATEVLVDEAGADTLTGDDSDPEDGEYPEGMDFLDHELLSDEFAAEGDWGEMDDGDYEVDSDLTDVDEASGEVNEFDDGDFLHENHEDLEEEGANEVELEGATEPAEDAKAESAEVHVEV